MNAELFKKIAPKAYYGKYLEQDIRPDGREIDEGRGLIISDAHINTANGSCFVRLGNTAVICGIKVELESPKEATITEGDLEVTVTLSPLSNPRFFLGKPTSQARFYSEVLKELFKQYVINLGELYNADIKKTLFLHIDLIVIDYEGSVFDACCLALLGSLYTLRIPKYKIVKDEVVEDYENCKHLSLKDTPISITFGLFDDFEVMDPDVFEEDLLEDSVSVILGMDNKILSICKPGGKAISDEMLNAMRDKARDRFNDIYTVVEEFKQSLALYVCLHLFVKTQFQINKCLTINN